MDTFKPVRANSFVETGFYVKKIKPILSAILRLTVSNDCSEQALMTCYKLPPAVYHLIPKINVQKLVLY